MTTFSVELETSPHEMAREEICKQISFLSDKIANGRFSENGKSLCFDAPASIGPELCMEVSELVNRVNTALSDIQRKVIFKSSALSSIRFPDEVASEGIHVLGVGQVALSGLPLRLFRYFDRVFEGFGVPWSVESINVPALIPASVLSRCDYFRSFPHSLTFASHLKPDVNVVSGFRSRHQHTDHLDPQCLSDMATPEACLSPAVCYHIYHLVQDQHLPGSGQAYGVCGKCFRYESSNMIDMRRLWDFTMREVVFLGAHETVHENRERTIDLMAEFLEQHHLAGEIRTASDPFFVAPESVSKTCFQLSSNSKFEVSLLLPENQRIAVASHNYHGEFFGRAFNITLENSGHSHSACTAFGLERWVYAFLAQHGANVNSWPGIVNKAPEFRR